MLNQSALDTNFEKDENKFQTQKVICIIMKMSVLNAKISVRFMNQKSDN